MTKKDTPVFGAVYSPPGRGKTLSLIRAFPDGLFVAPAGATKCGSWLGHQPHTMRADGIHRIPEIIKKFGPKYPAIIFSDLSIVADEEMRRIRAQMTGWNVSNRYNDLFIEARDAARDADCHIWWEFHETPPREKGGKVLPGGFAVAGWRLPDTLPGVMDVVARIVYDDTLLGSWPYAFSVEPDQSYVTKDRLNVFPGRFPLNVREPMLAAGYDIPRPPTLAWMDEFVAKISNALLKGGDNFDPKEVLRKSIPAIQKKTKEPKTIRWVLADAIDRANLRRFQASMLDRFIDSVVIDDELE